MSKHKHLRQKMMQCEFPNIENENTIVRLAMDGALVHLNVRTVVILLFVVVVPQNLRENKVRLLNEYTNLAAEDRVKRNAGSSSDHLMEHESTPIIRDRGRGREKGSKPNFKLDLLKEVAEILKKEVQDTNFKGNTGQNKSCSKQEVELIVDYMNY